MTSLPEQFSAARLTQLDNGFNLVQSFSNQALDQTNRVIALQLNASRAAIEQSTAAARQLLAARDPRDLLALGAQSQQQLKSLLDYGSELFSIVAGAKFTPLRSYSADALNAITTANAAAAPKTAETAPAAEAVQFVAPVSEPESAPAFAVVTSAVEPTSAPTAIAQAASEMADMPVAPPHPVAASMPVEVSVEIELPKVEPVDATPPVANTTTTTKVTEIRGTKGRRKQN